MHQTSAVDGFGWYVTTYTRFAHVELAIANNAEEYLISQSQPGFEWELPLLTIPTVDPPYWSDAAHAPSRTEVKALDPDSEFLAPKFESASGWPLACLKWEARCARSSGFWRISGGIKLGANYNDRNWVPDLDQTVLPLTPIWFGLGINLGFYFLLLVLGKSAWHIFVYKRRTARGQCVWCGYPARSGEAYCSECGQPRAINKVPMSVDP